jgi:hypothetical protein
LERAWGGERGKAARLEDTKGLRRKRKITNEEIQKTADI